MSDEQQTESGANVNTIRKNVPVGESRDFIVTAVHGENVVAKVAADGPDFDGDNVTFVPEDFRPEVGSVAHFTHIEDASKPSGTRLEVSAVASTEAADEGKEVEAA